jgi:hypothetical protein
MAGNSLKNSQLADHLKQYRFKAGQSGNPDGRPRGTREFAELIAEETRGGAELVEYALAVLRSRSQKAPKVWAVEYLTERMLGRAPQSIELSGKDGVPVQFGDARERLVDRLTAIVTAALGRAGDQANPAIRAGGRASRLKRGRSEIGAL